MTKKNGMTNRWGSKTEPREIDGRDRIRNPKNSVYCSKTGSPRNKGGGVPGELEWKKKALSARTKRKPQENGP